MNEEVRQRFQRLAAAYKSRLPGVLAELRQSLKDYFTTPDSSGDILEKCYLTVHKLKGTGSSFGLNSVTFYSTKIEKTLSLIKQDKLKPEEALLNRIFEWMEKMESGDEV